MAKLLIRLSQEGRNDGSTALRVGRRADLQMKPVEWVDKAVRIAADEVVEVEVEPGIYAVDAHGRNGRWSYKTVRVDADAPCEIEVTPERAKFRHVEVVGTVSDKPSAFDVLSTDSAIDKWVFALDDKTETSCPRTAVAVDDEGDVPLRRPFDAGRHWVRYRRDGVPVVASVPLGPRLYDDVEQATLRVRYRDLPAMAFFEGDKEAAVMSDLLVSGTSGAEMYYQDTFAQDELLSLLERRPLHFLAFALGQTREPFGAGLPALVAPSTHDDWLPDMLILQANRRLFWYGHGDNHVEKSADLFLRAMKTGVPYFTRSLRLLSEGLMILEGTKPEVAEASRLARRLSTRVYPEETFTTIRLDY